MKDQIHLLVQIQGIDLKRNKQKDEEKKLPEKLKAAEQTINKKKEEVAQLRAKAAQRDKERREKELELKIHEENIVKLKEKLTKLKTNEEYKANLKEIDLANIKKGELEETLLMSMDEGDLLKKELSSQEGTLREVERQFNAEKQAIEAELSRLSVSGQAIDAEWASLAEKAEKAILDQYKKLLLMGKGLAVVSVEGNTCSGCHFNLPPQLIAEVRTGEKLLTCTYCHRILYVPVKAG